MSLKENSEKLTFVVIIRSFL